MSIESLEDDLLAFAAAGICIRCRPSNINVDMFISTSDIDEAINGLNFVVPSSIS
jgi:hypothetical protein